MTPENTTNNDPPFRTPNPTELKAAAVEDSLLERYPHETDDDINEEHPDARQPDIAGADIDDPTVAEKTSSQAIKANLSGH